jgi:8-oxo-dGTP pyrophosphatase MutT (NUDIX family)
MKSKKAKKKARKGHALRQIAVLPYRQLDSGTVEVLLLTSRSTRRFVIPKGWQMSGKTNAEAAAIEAKQEAGITGAINTKPCGSYHYWKRLRDAFVPVKVIVYALEVEAELSEWKEMGERKKRLLTLAQAASVVEEPELVSLLAGFRPGGPAGGDSPNENRVSSD